MFCFENYILVGKYQGILFNYIINLSFENMRKVTSSFLFIFISIKSFIIRLNQKLLEAIIISFIIIYGNSSKKFN